MVREHLAVVSRDRGTSTSLDQHIIAHISKLRVGQLSIVGKTILTRVECDYSLADLSFALEMVSDSIGEDVPLLHVSNGNNADQALVKMGTAEAKSSESSGLQGVASIAQLVQEVQSTAVVTPRVLLSDLPHPEVGCLPFHATVI
ncbi:hypothetical protein AXG93_2783s1000 [Marchantia polymorpha subsp. ruderalis]|uniref:Uncharacterized protein n=1 Tax=Marchantia polymorpha subsp. ruderalis TaxID=1480154 RepID=A0A176WHD4_MARPO|nr:hypothetical protein AXG93_2783s1000 [Marchantia polymorpha subsp. ruderalis]